MLKNGRRLVGAVQDEAYGDEKIIIQKVYIKTHKEKERFKVSVIALT